MTTTLTVPGTAPAAAFGQLVRNEVRLAWRQPTSLIGGLALPAALLIIFSFIPTFRQPQASLGGFSPLEEYVPILIGFSLAMLALFGLPIPLVTYRELGVLRRLSTTPVPPSWLLAAQGVVQLGVALAGLAGILVAGAALGTPAPANPAGFAVAVVLSVAGLFPLGLLIAAMARTANGASVIGRLVLIPMLFFAGLWWPRELHAGRAAGRQRRRPAWRGRGSDPGFDAGAVPARRAAAGAHRVGGAVRLPRHALLQMGVGQMESFIGKLAVVTGGGSGIGRELVRQLAAQGCSVATCDWHPDAVAETAALARADAGSGVLVTSHACDVSDEAQVLRFRDELLGQHARDHVDLVSPTRASAVPAASSRTAGRSGSTRSPSTGGACTTAPGPSCRC